MQYNEDTVSEGYIMSHHERLRETFKTKCKELKKPIKKSKSYFFKELCEKLDENPLGGRYIAVKSKVRGDKGQTSTSPVLLKNIVETFFIAQKTYPLIP